MRTRLSVQHAWQKVSEGLWKFLQQGISPEKLALALAVGVTVGTMPLLGATTFLCTMLALWLRLNLPFLQLVNYIVYPVQLFLYIPFLKLGSELFSDQPFRYGLNEIIQKLTDDLWNTIGEFFFVNLYALLLWLCLAPFLMGFTYLAGLLFFKAVLKKMSKETKLNE